MSAETEFWKNLPERFDISARAMRLLAASTRELAAVLWEPVRQAYEEAGRPYGPFDEDMKRWWEDRGIRPRRHSE
jgi:hypothetical protein